MAEIMPTYPEGTRQWAQAEVFRLHQSAIESDYWAKRHDRESQHLEVDECWQSSARAYELSAKCAEEAEYFMDEASKLEETLQRLPLGEPIYSRDELRAAGQKWFRFPRRKLC